MVGVCFFYEDQDTDVFSGRPEMLHAWNYALKSAGDVTRVAIINLTAKRTTFNKAFDYRVYEDIKEFYATADGSIMHVGAANEFDKSISLWNYKHDDDWLVFGPAHGHPKLPYGLTIPAANNSVFHAVHAATVIMTHRYEVLK